MSGVHLFVLDVGHGSSAVLADDVGVVVIDAGPGTGLLEFLTREGIDKIDVLLISHADKDHVKGVISLLESRMALGVVQLNTDSEKGTDTWDDMLYELHLASRDGKVKFKVGLTTSDTGEFDTGRVHIEILAPSPYLAGKGPGSVDRLNRVLTPNSVSAVIRLTMEGAPVALLAGDIDGVGLSNLIEEKKDASAPVVVFPHHGGRPGKDADLVAFTTTFCKAVSPKAVIFSTGRGSHGTPRKEITETIRAVLSKPRIMCTQLSENCAAKLGAKRPAHLARQYAQGKEKGRCCAGTVVIRLTKDKIAIYPDENRHLAFIQKAAPKALCLIDIPSAT